MKGFIFLFITFLFGTYILPGFANEPVHQDGFVAITKNVLDKFNVLKDDARNSNFNQLKNHKLHEQFDEIRILLKEYENDTANNVYSWPEGRQKEIVSKLHVANFLYRSYSLTQHDEFRENAEKSLLKAQDLFQKYISQVKNSKKGYWNN